MIGKLTSSAETLATPYCERESFLLEKYMPRDVYSYKYNINIDKKKGDYTVSYFNHKSGAYAHFRKIAQVFPKSFLILNFNHNTPFYFLSTFRLEEEITYSLIKKNTSFLLYTQCDWYAQSILIAYCITCWMWRIDPYVCYVSSLDPAIHRDDSSIIDDFSSVSLVSWPGDTKKRVSLIDWCALTYTFLWSFRLGKLCFLYENNECHFVIRKWQKCQVYTAWIPPFTFTFSSLSKFSI